VSTPPVKVRLYLQADPANTSRNRLVEEVTPPTGNGSNITWPSANTRTRVVGTNILNSSTNALFCYDDATSATTASCASTTPALADITSVRVNLDVQRSTTTGVASLDSQVWLPNVAAEAVTL
jgi:hypothetical protein